jgi:hypothetical protein
MSKFLTYILFYFTWDPIKWNCDKFNNFKIKLNYLELNNLNTLKLSSYMTLICLVNIFIL